MAADGVVLVTINPKGVNAVYLNEEKIYSELAFVSGDATVERRMRFAACPTCGDSLMTRELLVPDHGRSHKLYIGWCMDCLDIKGWALFVEPEYAEIIKRRVSCRD